MHRYMQNVVHMWVSSRLDVELWLLFVCVIKFFVEEFHTDLCCAQVLPPLLPIESPGLASRPARVPAAFTPFTSTLPSPGEPRGSSLPGNPPAGLGIMCLSGQHPCRRQRQCRQQPVVCHRHELRKWKRSEIYGTLLCSR